MIGIGTQVGRPRLPVEHLVATQTYLRDPKSYADRLATTEALAIIPLGMVSPQLALHELMIDAWSCFTRELTWLRESDRAIIELACFLRVKVWKAIVSDDENLEIAWVNGLRQVLGAIGATPTTISKILVKTKEDATKPKKGARYASWGTA